MFTELQSIIHFFSFFEDWSLISVEASNFIESLEITTVTIN